MSIVQSMSRAGRTTASSSRTKAPGRTSRTGRPPPACGRPGGRSAGRTAIGRSSSTFLTHGQRLKSFRSSCRSRSSNGTDSPRLRLRRGPLRGCSNAPPLIQGSGGGTSSIWEKGIRCSGLLVDPVAADRSEHHDADRDRAPSAAGSGAGDEQPGHRHPSRAGDSTSRANRRAVSTELARRLRLDFRRIAVFHHRRPSDPWLLPLHSTGKKIDIPSDRG